MKRWAWRVTSLHVDCAVRRRGCICEVPVECAVALILASYPYREPHAVGCATEADGRTLAARGVAALERD